VSLPNGKEAGPARGRRTDGLVSGRGMGSESGWMETLVCRLREAELGGGWCDVALPILAGEHRAATLTSVAPDGGEPR
jgi:hypothetical protein